MKPLFDIVDDVFPLTSMQSGMLNQCLESETGLYVEQFGVEILGKYDEKCDRKAWELVVQAHPALRTQFYFTDLKEAHQVVLPADPVNIPWMFEDNSKRNDFCFKSFAEQEKFAGFSLEGQILFRVRLIRVTPEKHYMLLTIHHLITDGWSLNVLANDLKDAYSTLILGQSTHCLPAPSLATHLHRLDSLNLDDMETFWSQKLGKMNPGKGLDRQSGHIGEGECSIEMSQNSHWRQKIQAQCQRLHISESSVFQSACSLVLSRWTHEDTCVLGMTTVMRDMTQSDEARIVGPLLNTIPQGWIFDWQQSNHDYLKARHSDLSECFNHNRLPLKNIIARAGWDNRQPFEVVTVYQYEESKEPNSIEPAFTMTPVIAHESVGYPIAIYAWPGDTFRLQIRFDASKWGQKLMNSLARSIFNVMSLLIQDEKVLLQSISTSSDFECDEVVFIEDEKEQMVPERFLELVQGQPDKPALHNVLTNTVLTYKELWVASNNVIQLLKHHGVSQGDCIACYSENDHHSLINMLAVMMMGGCYLGLDTYYPAERIVNMLDDSDASLILISTQVPEFLEAYCQERNKPCINSTLNTLPHLVEYKRTELSLNDGAYLIYTSGSTGKPKASLNLHSGLANRLAYLRNEFKGRERDNQQHRFLQCAGMSFDASILEMMMVLACGGTMVFDDIHRTRNPAAITEVIRSNHISNIFLPPALLMHVDSKKVPELKVVSVGGERCPEHLAQEWSNRGLFFNFYGPSEASIFCIVNPAHETRVMDSIGLVLPGVQVVLCDQCGHDVPQGVSGELLIGESGLARGYHRRVELTQERFIMRNNQRYYRSGDKCQSNADNYIYILDRIDSQIKIRGVRVELTEIERILASIPRIKEALVVPVWENQAVKALHAFYLTEQGQPMALDYMRQQLMQQLPNAVIPAHFTALAAWPLTANNKVDKKCLLNLSGLAYDEYSAYDEKETRLVKVLESVLKSNVSSLARSFFELGGSSLNVAQCISELQKEFNINLAMTEFYQLSSMQALADWLKLTDKGQTIPFSHIISTYDLNKEASLDIDITVDVLKVSSKSSQRWLLTGATGFVGAHLCANILRYTEHEIVCVVRAETAENGKQRVIDKLKQLCLWQDSYTNRFTIIQGDLAKPKLGVSEFDWSDMCKSIHHIVHCGALVNFAYPYGLLKAANVESTKWLISLASTSVKKSMDFISTMSLISAAQSYDQIDETMPMPNWQQLVGGYNQSKWVAEQLCLQAMEKGIDISIYRLASMTGDCKVGLNNQKDIIWRAVQACDLLGAYPISTVLADLTATDEISQVIIKAKVQGYRRNIWHLSNPNKQSWQSLYETTPVQGRMLEGIPATEWRQKLMGWLNEYPELTNLLPYTAMQNDHSLVVPLSVKCDHTQSYLNDLQLTLSAVDNQLLSHYLSSLTYLTSPQ